MAAGPRVFLRWASPPLAEGDPRVGAPPGDDPDALVSVCRWPVRVPGGAAAALSIVAERLGGPAGPRRIVACGGETGELLAALDGSLRRPGDDLLLVPPNIDGAADVASIALALAGAPAGGAIVVQSAVTPTGGIAPLAEIGTLCERHCAQLLVDLTLARYTALPPGPPVRPAAVFAALDRWDFEPPGTWGVAVRPGVLVWSEAPPATLLHMDAALRGALLCHASVTLWPLAGRRHGTGVVAFTIAGWSAEEAADLLAQAFGIVLESGNLTAAPLPLPGPLGTGLLRASIAPSSTADDIAAFSVAMSRLAEARLTRGRAH